jgi:hypothetical protein
MNPILFDQCEAQTNQDIHRLETRRNSIFERLRTVYEAVKQLIRKEPLFEDVEPFLSQNAERADIQAKAFEHYLKRENDTLGILPRFAAEALGKVPEDVKEVLEAWEQFRNGPDTDDPKRYWSDTKQKFRALPVTDKERESIAARNCIYVKDEERARLLDYARNVATALNYASEHHNIKMYPGDLFQDQPFLHPILKFKQEPALHGKRFVFSPNIEGLTFRQSSYSAFDEG